MGCNLSFTRSLKASYLVSRPSILLTVFLMGRLGYPNKGRNLGDCVCVCVCGGRGGGGLSANPKVSYSVGYHLHQKVESPRLSPDYTPRIAKMSLIALEKFYQKFCLWRIFSTTQSWLIWKSSLELNPLIQNSVQQDYLIELYVIIPLSLYEKLLGMRRYPSQHATN